MKKYTFLLSFFIVSFTNAQLDKGSKLIGLQTHLAAHDMYVTRNAVSFGSAGHDLGLNLIPTYGYAVQRNWLIGAQATFGIQSTRYKGFFAGFEQTDTYTDIGIAPFTRLYLDLTKNKKWKLFGVAAFEINRSGFRTHYTGGSFPSKTYSSVTNGKGSIGGGLAYFGKKLTVDLSMSNTALRLGFYRANTGRKK